MTDKINKFLMGVLLVATITACVYTFRQRQEQTNLELIEQQLHQLQLQYAPAERDTIRDSLKVLTQQVIQMPQAEYKLFAADRQLLQDLKLRLSQVSADHRVSMVSSDTVKADRQSSVFTFCDDWLSLRLDTADSMLTYRARDSLQTIIARRYKHKFLWWRWGTRGYDVKVVNFNPHSTLTYNSYIQVNQ